MAFTFIGSDTEYDWSVNNALSVHEDKKSAIYSTNQSIHYLPLIYIYLSGNAHVCQLFVIDKIEIKFTTLQKSFLNLSFH